MAQTILSDFSSETAKNFELNAGILVKNVTDAGSLDYTTGVKLGATTGGKSIDFSMEMRNLFEDVDGARGKYMGGDIIDSRDAALTVTLLEQTSENLKIALVASDETANTALGVTLTPRDTILDTDYITNICWFGTIKGTDLPMCIELKNCLSESFTFTAEDKGKGTIECEIHPRKDLSNPEQASFLIHMPPAPAV